MAITTAWNDGSDESALLAQLIDRGVKEISAASVMAFFDEGDARARAIRLDALIARLLPDRFDIAQRRDAYYLGRAR